MSAFAQRIVQAIGLILLFSPLHLSAEEPDNSTPLTPAEAEFVALAQEYQKELDAFYEEADKLTDRDQKLQFYKERHPRSEYLPKFLAFEQAHVGEDAGLDALNQVFRTAAGNGDPESNLVGLRREALAQMQPYEDRELAMYSVGFLMSGVYDPQVTDYLERLANSSTANPKVRAYARLRFAENALSTRTTKEYTNQWLEDFGAGLPAEFPELETYLRNQLASFPPQAELDAQATEAVAMLEELAASGDQFRTPAFRSFDPTRQLIRINAEKMKSNTPLADKAAGLLFQERRLRLGLPAPDLQLELVDGQTWSLANQGGKVVVVQFSFTGCGPCEAMYPDLRTMQMELGDRVALLTILRDETSADAEHAKESGKITWPIHVDIVPGKLCSQWAVNSFPEIYVIDAQGQIAAIGYRGKALRWKADKLLADAAASAP